MAEAPLSFQREIISELRGGKKLDKWREPEDPVKYAYTKLLRERDKTRRIYDVDPFAEVYTLRENIYGIYTESLDGMGDPWIFLINGPEKALLIDTSFGLGDLKGLVHELIGDKPYYVANTHSHFDHAYGNYQFDRVYCHEYEAPKILANMNEHVWDYMLDENGNGVWYDFKREDLVKFREYEVVGVPDGYTFDLGGGHEVELVFLPGHSTGHCGFLDKKNRVFFPGDDCCVGILSINGNPGLPYAEYATVEGVYKELVKITARMDEFDSLFPSHGMVETGPIMLVSTMETCKKVLDDPACYDYRTENLRGGDPKAPSGSNIRYGKMIYGSGYLMYKSASVYMDRDAGLN